MWLLPAIIGYLALAITAILDKFILSKAISKPIVFVFYSSFFILPIALLLPFGVNRVNIFSDILVCAVAGFAFSFALWSLYKGIQLSEISHVGPLVGAMTPFFALFLSGYFLEEILNGRQLLAVGFLILGSLLISFEQSKLNHGWHKGMLWGVLAGFLFAISHVASKYIYSIYGFYTGFVWTRVFMGIFGLLLLFSKDVRDNFKIKNKKQGRQAKKQIILVLTSRILAILGVVFVQYAISVGKVSLVNSLEGLQYGLVVIFVALLSKFYPKLFREDYTKIEIYQEILAILLIGLGLGLLV